MVAAVVKKKHVGAALLACLVAGPATAHPEISPEVINRYLSVIVVGDRLEYFVTLLYGQFPGWELRKELDGNHDGTIDAAELERAAASWKARAPTLATIALDGQPVPLGEMNVNLQLGPEPAVTAAPVVVELYGSRPLEAHGHELRLEAGADPARLGETEITADYSPDWQLAASREGRGPEGTERRFLFQGRRPSAVADRSVTFRLRPTAPVKRRSTTTLVAAGVAALAGVALFLELRRRQRKSAASV